MLDEPRMDSNLDVYEWAELDPPVGAVDKFILQNWKVLGEGLGVQDTCLIKSLKSF